MAASFLEKIDWTRPWLAHVRSVGEAIANAPDWREELNRRAALLKLRNHHDLSIRFVTQAELPAGVAYETYIYDTGCVPTRENLHDFFNALIWLTFPHIKIRLNVLQAQEIERLAGVGMHRGKVRDAATIFDENAVLLVTSNTELVTALRQHAWIDIFLTQRETFIKDCNVLLFGHALMEKLVAPYKSITGHMWVMSENFAAEASADERVLLADIFVARQLANGLTTNNFSPLPILGVPGWWENQNECFYADATVFRAKRLTD